MIIILILLGFIVMNNGVVRGHSKQTKMIWLFIALIAVHVPFAVNNFFAFTTLQGMVLYMPFILSCIACVNSIDRLKKIMVVCIGLMIYVAGHSLVYGGVGSGNYFEDENDLSLYINMWIPFCYFLFLVEKNKVAKLLFATGIVVGISSVVVTFSRGGFVGLVAMFIVMFLVSSRKIITLVVVAACVLLLINLGTMVTNENYNMRYWERMSTATDPTEGTAEERLNSWKAGWYMFLDNPLGVGGNNFQVRFPEYQPPEMPRGMWGRVAHSLWFTLLPELGIIGVWIFFTLLFYNIKDLNYLRVSFKNSKDHDMSYFRYFSLACFASFAGYFASGTFISVLYYPHYWYLTAFIVAAVNIAAKVQSEDKKTFDSIKV